MAGKSRNWEKVGACPERVPITAGATPEGLLEQRRENLGSLLVGGRIGVGDKGTVCPSATKTPHGHQFPLNSQEQRPLEPKSNQENESGTSQRVPGIFASAALFPVPFLPRLLPLSPPFVSNRSQILPSVTLAQPWIWQEVPQVRQRLNFDLFMPFPSFSPGIFRINPGNLPSV